MKLLEAHLSLQVYLFCLSRNQWDGLDDVHAKIKYTDLYLCKLNDNYPEERH